MALAQLFFLREAIRRRARSLRHRWGRRQVAQQRSFTLEPLEGRILLSADLTGLVAAHTLLDPSVPTNAEQATIRVTNSGDAKTTQISQVAVYASLDGTLDGGDILLGTAAAPRTINPGASKDVSVALSIPETLAAGTYNLLARVDATNVIPENSETNNVVTGPSFGVAWQFGAVPGRAGNTTLTLADADGTQVTFTLSGPGAGEVIRDGANWDIRVTGTSTASALAIQTNTAGNGRVAIQDIHVLGSLASLTATTTDLSGTLAIDGSAGFLNLGSVQGGTVAAQSITQFGAGSLTNATILVGANLGQDGQVGGSGADADTYGAGTLGAFAVSGAVTGSTIRVGVDPVDGIYDNGNDIIVGGTASAIGAIIIGGTLSSDSQVIAGALPASASINGSTVTNLADQPQFSSETIAPTITVGLASDTGASFIDALTNNPAITGSVTDASGIASFVAGFGATPTFDVLADRQADGSFLFTQARLEQIYGGPLTDGTYTLALRATDSKGNYSQTTLAFTLDTTLAVPTFDLAAVSDTQVVGDQQTTAGLVTLLGNTDPGVVVELLGAGLTTTADASGVFTFANVSLVLGANSLTARATDAAGNQRDYSRTITRVAAPVLTPIGNQTIDETVPFQFTATATDADTPASGLTFSLVNAPTGAGIDSITGLFTWAPTETQGPGSYTFDVMVTDSSTPALSDNETITVTVNEVNVAPVLNAIGNQSVDEETELRFTIGGSDVDDPTQPLTYGATGLPSGATFDPTTREFVWTPIEAQGSGSYNVTFSVTDGVVTTSELVTITVGEVNVAPVLNAIGNQSVDEETELRFTIGGSDVDVPVQTLTYSASGLPTGASFNATTREFVWTPTEAQGPGAYQVTFSVTDGVVTTSELVTIDAFEINVAPVNTVSGARAANEDTVLPFTGANTISVNDADGNLAATQLTVANGTLTVNLTGGATISAGANSSATLTLAGTQVQINLALATLSYRSALNANGEDVLTVLSTDSAGTPLSASDMVAITVNPVNDAPAGTDTTIPINEDTSYAVTAADFGFTDLNDSPANSFQAVTISTVPGTGTLTFNGIPVNAGDVITLSPAGVTWTARANSQIWRSVASSADGMKLVAAVQNGQLYTSTDAGVTWTARESNRQWVAVASSADGMLLVAAVEYGGQLYTSTDAGVTWTARASVEHWQRVASSADGMQLVAVVGGGQLYTSTDAGVTWTARTSSLNWTGVASSAGGAQLVAAVGSGQLYTSTDAGVTWTARESNRLWSSVASSADGTQLVAAVGSGQLYTSTDAGVSWTARESNRLWVAVVSSADGTQLVASVVNGQLYTSLDAGVTWTARESNRLWSSVASSADGTQLVAAVSNGKLYTSTALPGLVFTPAANANGASYASFNFQVQDNGGTANTGVDLDPTPNTLTFNVTAVNDAPVLNAIGNQSVNEGAVLSFTATATDSDLPANSLTFSLQGPVPTGAIIDPNSGAFSWTPTEEQGPNTYSVTVRVTDNGSPNLFAEETIQITVGEANIAPVIGNLEDRTVEDGQLLSFTATAIDSDIPVNDLTFSLQGTVPAGAAIDPNTGAFTWTPIPAQIGSQVITVRVTDNGTPALYDEKSFTVVVNASDHDGPSLTIGLVNDTGSSSTDRITKDPAVTGSATDLSSVTSLKAGFGPTSTFDVTGDLQPDGSFILSITRLEQINGSPLADGSKTLQLEATDSRGNVSTFSLNFTLDRTAPGAPSVDLLATSDSGVSNTDNITSDNTPTVRAISESGTLRLFINGSQSASVATAGTYNFTPNTALNDGVLSFTASVEDIAGNESAIGTVTVTIDTVAPPLNFDLDAASDTAPIGDQQTLVPIVTIDGQTEPNVLLLLQIGVPFQGLGDVAGGSFYSSTTKLSADGSVVIGSSLSAGGQEGFYWAAPAGPIQGVGDLSGGIYYSAAGDISADGGVVIGASYSDFGSGAPSNLEAFRWTSSTGLQRLGDLSGGPITSVANAVSADGLVIVGSSGSDFGYPGQISGTEAFRWTAGGGMQRLGWIPGGSAYSVARDVSADGQVIVGQGFAGYFQAFRWTASGGMVGLGDLPGGSSESNAWYVINDGSIVVGESKSNFGVTGVDDYQAFLWTVGGGMVGLGDLPGGPYQSRPTAISADGSAVVGYSGSNFGFAGLSSTQAFRWTQAGGMIGLGDLPGGSYYSEARAVSGDGLVVVGYSVGTSGQEAFIWDANHGMRSLKTVLESDYGFGLLLNGWRLTSATSISADGLVIAGTGINPNGQTEGWRVSLAHPGVSGTADPTGAFTFEGVALDEGANAVRIYATDLAGNRADTVRTITRIPNAPPELAAIGNRSLVAGQQLLFIAAATDGETPVGDLRYSLENAPAGATIDPVTGLFIWTPTGAQVGTHSFDVVVTDNGLSAKSDHETIQVTVSAVPEDFQQVFLQTSLAGYDLASTADKAVSLDFNGDGRDDLFLYRPGQGPAWLLRSNGDGTFTAVKTGNGLAGHDFASGGDRAVALDFNGDGRDDLMIYRYGQNIVKFLQSNGDATFTQVWVSGSGMNGFHFTTGNERVETLDFNGDGRDDVLLYRVGEGSAMLLRSNDNGTFSAVASGNGLAGYSFTSLYDHALALDFNGDGKDDLLFYRSGSRIAWLNQSNGDGSFTRVMETYDGFVSYDLVSTADFAVSLDVNDDGRDDVWFYRPGAGSQNILFESRGDGTFVSRGFRYGILGYDLASYADMALSLDDNGDGRDDLFIIRPGQGKAFLAHSVVPNVTPVLNAISNYAIEAGGTLTFTASGSDANQPGQTLTYALTGAVPQGASVDPHTGVFSWTPTESQIGVHSFNVVISDDGSVPLSDGQAIQITVNPYVNVAPVLDAIGDKAGAAAQLLTFTATASDSDLPPDTLTYTLDDGSGGAVPFGAVIDPISGVFSWTPALAQAGVHTFDVVVTDNGTPNLIDRETITVTVGGEQVANNDSYTVQQDSTLMAGTVMLKDIEAGSGSTQLLSFTNVNGTLFFVAGDGVNGQELWKSDGTAAGTVLVKDIVAGIDGSGPTSLTNVNGMLYFRANDGVNGYELWKSNGTADGTVLVKDILAGIDGSFPTSLTNVNGTLFFVAGDGVNGYELWKSNGTADGTVLVKDILAGSGSSSPQFLTNVNGTLFFQAFDGVNGQELWKSDGTADGTVLVKNIQAGIGSAAPQSLMNVNGRLFFMANDGVNGIELWVSGTATNLLANDTDSDSPTLTANLVTDPANGTLVLNADGTFTYKPNVGFSGTDSFTYQASDGTNVSNLATVTITVTPKLAFVPPITFNATSTTITLNWRTTLPTTTTLLWGIGTNTNLVATDPALVTVHSMTVTGLTPNTLYSFRWFSYSAEGEVVTGGPFTVRTNR